MNSLSTSWRSARRLLLKVALPSLAVLALACGDDSSDTSGSGASGGTDASSSSSSSGSGTGGSGGMGGAGMGGMGMGGNGVPGNYPSGPYGNDVGDTLAYLEFEGYVSPVSGNFGPYEDFSMLDIQNSGSPFVLIHLAAMF